MSEPLECSFWEHECSTIPTTQAEIRTSPFPICSLLTVVSRLQSIGRSWTRRDHVNAELVPFVE